MDRIDDTPTVRLDLGATVVARMSISENSSGGENIALIFDDVFCCAQRQVLSKKKGRKQTTFTLVSAQNPDIVVGAVLHYADCWQMANCMGMYVLVT